MSWGSKLRKKLCVQDDEGWGCLGSCSAYNVKRKRHLIVARTPTFVWDMSLKFLGEKNEGRVDRVGGSWETVRSEILKRRRGLRDNGEGECVSCDIPDRVGV